MTNTAPFYVIARQINRHGECDFLCAEDHPRGSWCLAARRALRFHTIQEAAQAHDRMRAANPSDHITVMDMTEQEASKPGFWTIRESWKERLDQAASGAIDKAPARQEFDLSALPLFGD